MSAKDPHDIKCFEALLQTWPTPAPQPATPPDADDGMPDFDVKWAAGLFDGEGCIQMVCQWPKSGGAPSYNLRVSMTQNDLEVLEHFQRGMGVGGHIYTLNFASADSIALLQRLGPYLVRKRVELALARRYWTEGEPGRRSLSARARALRKWLHHEMQRVKRSEPAPSASVDEAQECAEVVGLNALKSGGGR